MRSSRWLRRHVLSGLDLTTP